ncbi:MAG: 1-deoxy-D-xylulose-5-phosphate reductoisomerase [Candidatus Melainabacteria bacterium]|nr:1-deoxy-D-xylulose-5-phosphate reductoisomerase [Candidatus Melainabacteria bacterium]
MQPSKLTRISLLGSTGSIGLQTLDIVENHKEHLQVVALCAGSNSLEKLTAQIIQFKPELVCVPTEEDRKKLIELLGARRPGKLDIVTGEAGLTAAASLTSCDLVVTGVVGAVGIKPTWQAVRAGKNIALANKETLVAAGSVIMSEAHKNGVKIIPVDSEHSAIFQSLQGYSNDDIDYLWLTGSGGPFRTWSKELMESATKSDALKHPNWSMGPKITIDSATMMNKGLEIIEARWLFNLSAKKIKVLVHPQSILHSAVEYKDGSIVGQMGVPDMRLPIHYALFYPERVPSSRVPRLDLVKLGSLTFEPPDYDKFPCLLMAKEVAESDTTLPCVLNAANEVIVDSFLKDLLPFKQIPRLLEAVLSLHKPVKKPDLDDIFEADAWARQEAFRLVSAPISSI